MINFEKIVESAKPLKGALGGFTSNVQLAHLPGFGLVFATSVYCRTDSDLNVAIDQAKTVLFGLAGMLSGLSDSDVVAVTLNAYVSERDENIMALVRMSPGDPSSLKVYQDGQPR